MASEEMLPRRAQSPADQKATDAAAALAKRAGAEADQTAEAPTTDAPTTKASAGNGAAGKPPPNPLARRMVLRFDGDAVRRACEARLRKIGDERVIKGFRRGHTPLPVLRRIYGAQVENEVLGDLADKRFREIIAEKNLRIAAWPHFIRADGERPDSAPAAAPRITTATSVANAKDAAAAAGSAPAAGAAMAAEAASASDGGDYGVAAVYEDLPEVPPPDFSGKELIRPTLTVGDAEVDEMIERLRRQRAEFTAVDRPAQDGDRMIVDFDGTANGEPFAEGGVKDFAFIFGGGQAIPAFEKNLIGARAGDEKTFTADFPADDPRERLRGKRAEFNARIKSVAEARLPEVDAAFMKALGTDADGRMDKFRDAVRRYLEQQVARMLAEESHGRALALLATATPPFPLPQTLIKSEIAALLARAKAELAARGVASARADPRALAAQAAGKVRLALIVNAFARAEKIEATPADIEARLQALSAEFEDPERFAAAARADSAQMRELAGAALEDLIAARVAEVAPGKSAAVSLSALMGETA